MEEERRHASPEGLRSEKDAASIVKLCENEKSATTTTKKHSKINFPDFRFSFSLLFTPKALKRAGRGGASPEGLFL